MNVGNGGHCKEVRGGAERNLEGEQTLAKLCERIGSGKPTTARPGAVENGYVSAIHIQKC